MNSTLYNWREYITQYSLAKPVQKSSLLAVVSQEQHTTSSMLEMFNTFDRMATLSPGLANIMVAALVIRFLLEVFIYLFHISLMILIFFL